MKKTKSYLFVSLITVILSLTFMSCPGLGSGDYTLTISIEPEGSGTVELTPEKDSYESGSLVTLTAQQNDGYLFSGWMGDIESIENPYELRMDSNKTITAKFISNTWTLATDDGGWTGRHSHTSVVFDDKIWILGGYNEMSDVWSSPDGVNWTEVASSTDWNGRYGHTTLVFDETDDGVDNPKMWVLGGFEFEADNDVWCSSDGENWTEVTPDADWEGRAGHVSVVFDGKMWVMGGENDSREYISDAWSSTDGENWTQESSIPGWSPRLDHSAVVFDDKMWIISGDHYGSTEIWSSANGISWTAVVSDLDDDEGDWYNRSGHTSVVFDNKMWIIGGYGMGEYDEVWASPDGVNWDRVMDSADWEARSNHTSVVFDNKIWIIAGSGGMPSTDYTDVWYLE